EPHALVSWARGMFPRCQACELAHAIGANDVVAEWRPPGGAASISRPPGARSAPMPTTSHMIRWFVALMALGLPAIALAHHGWSGYDSNTALVVEGTIRDAGYEHPHGYVKLESPEKTWLVVLAPPSRMEHRGLPASALKVGATARVEG